LNPTGNAWFAPIHVRTAVDKIREPDIAAFLNRDDPRAKDACFERADLVMEVVSPGAETRKRDYETKRDEYARAGIREYWIVDPKESRITVLTLKEGAFEQVCMASGREVARSVLVEGLQTEAERVFLRDPA
jgi:Uma2 family endonuclease